MPLLVVFIICFAIAFACAFLELTREARPYKSLLAALVIATLTLFAGLRYEVRADYSTYVTIFEHIDATIGSPLEIFTYWFDHHKIEPVVASAAWAAGLIGAPQLAFLAISFLTILFWYLGARLLTPYPLVATALYASHYYIINPYAQIRSGLAAAFFVLVFGALFHYRKSLKAFFWTATFGIGSHVSAAVTALPLALGQRRIFTPSPLFVTSLPLIALGIGATPLVSYLVQELVSLVPPIHDAYYSYIFAGRAGALERFDFQATKVFFLVILGLIIGERLKPNLPPTFYPLLLLLSVGLSMRFLFADFADMGGRLSAYFFVFDSIFISLFVAMIKPKLAMLTLVFMIGAAQIAGNYIVRDLNQPYAMWIFQS